MVDERSSGRLVELAQQCREDSDRWFGDSHASISMPHMVLALCGEAGELANLVKKADRGSIDGHSAEFKHDAAMEAADILTYLLNIAAMLRIDLESAYLAKRDHNERRFTEQRQQREANRPAANTTTEDGAGLSSV